MNQNKSKEAKKSQNGFKNKKQGSSSPNAKANSGGSIKQNGNATEKFSQSYIDFVNGAIASGKQQKKMEQFNVVAGRGRMFPANKTSQKTVKNSKTDDLQNVFQGLIAKANANQEKSNIHSSNSAEDLRTKINTDIIRRMDPGFEKLYASATQVAIYEYDSSSNGWGDSETVGCLFLYHRSTNPKYGIVVLNRKGMKNFLCQFDTSGRIIPQKPNLLFRSGPNDAIRCIWFYNETEFNTTTSMLQELGIYVDQPDNCSDGTVRNYNEVSTSSVNNMGNLKDGTNVFSSILQNNAQNKDKKSGVITAAELEQKMLQDPKPDRLPVTENPFLKPTNKPKSYANAVEGTSLLQKFSNLSTDGSGDRDTVPTANQNRSMQTVEQLEKDLKTATTSDAAKSNMRTELLATLGISNNTGNACHPEEPTVTPQCGNSVKKMTIDDFEGKLLEETDEHMVREVVENLADLKELILCSENVPGYQETQLVWRKRSNLENRPPSAVIHVPLNNGGSLVGLADVPMPPPTGVPWITPLTREQFAQGLMYLLQTDPSFVTKIHECYIKSLQPLCSPFRH